MTILKRSEIGDNIIIVIIAIVLEKLLGNVIIGGLPAKIIKPF
jgi:hypothetical protein